MRVLLSAKSASVFQRPAEAAGDQVAKHVIEQSAFLGRLRLPLGVNDECILPTLFANAS